MTQETTIEELRQIMKEPVIPPASEPTKEVPDGVTQARQHLCKAANLYLLCIRCVNNMISPHVPPIAQTSEMFQAAVGTLFIEASRMRFVDKMPAKPLVFK